MGSTEKRAILSVCARRKKGNTFKSRSSSRCVAGVVGCKAAAAAAAISRRVVDAKQRGAKERRRNHPSIHLTPEATDGEA